MKRTYKHSLPSDPQSVGESLKLWPQLGKEALHGPAGKLVTTISPQTEADPVAILIQFLVAFGSLIGRGPHFLVDAVRHSLNLFAVVVGATASSRKGTAWAHARSAVENVAAIVGDGWASNLQTGLSSGEGLIWAVRDPIESKQPIRQKAGGKSRKITGYKTVVEDHGVEDKRLPIVEPEFASTLKVAARDGNTLSPVLRLAWDGNRLQILTKNSPAKATDAHISVIGHITKFELRRYLTETDQANGLANRFLWVLVRRSKLLPDGGALELKDLLDLIFEISESYEFAKTVEEMRRDDKARSLWHQVYAELSGDGYGLRGAITARAEAQTMRLACLYALLDQSADIREEHLRSALAVWRYCEESVRFIFGDALGHPVADKILTNLRQSPEGLSRTELTDLFKRNRTRTEIQNALDLLVDRGLARFSKELTNGSGRAPELWFTTDPLEGISGSTAVKGGRT